MRLALGLTAYELFDLLLYGATRVSAFGFRSSLLARGAFGGFAFVFRELLGVGHDFLSVGLSSFN
jgi:hypothetical protein